MMSGHFYCAAKPGCLVMRRQLVEMPPYKADSWWGPERLLGRSRISINLIWTISRRRVHPVIKGIDYLALIWTNFGGPHAVPGTSGPN